MSSTLQQESVWREHRERLLRFVLGRVSNAETAEDIVHDVLLRAYEKRDTLRDDQKLEQWLYQITRNAVIDHYRVRKRTSPLPENLPDPGSASENEVLAELSQCIQPFVQALPKHYRDAVELSEIRGLTQQETAEQLGLSLSGAKSRVQRGRRMLGDMMLECCKVEFDSLGTIMSCESRAGGVVANNNSGGCRKC